MSQFNFDQLIDRRATNSQKWDKYKDPNIIPMWVADTDFMAAPPIIEALKQRIDHGLFGYTNTPQSLNQVFVNRLARLYNWDVSAESLVWLPGLVTGLNLSVRAVCEPTKSAITATPIYPPFNSAPKLSGCEVVTVPMKLENGRELIDFQKLEASIDSNCRILLFCNPHNPGGAVYRRHELEQLAEIVKRNNLVLCSDEIHCDLILEPGLKHIPIANLDDDIRARTVTLMAPSKTWNIAGLGCSVAIIEDPKIRQQFQQVRRGIVPSVNLLGYTAAEAAYSSCEDWNQEQLDYLRKNRDLLVERINAIDGLKLNRIEATYLAWIDISEAEIKDPEAFFEGAGVGLSPGSDFGSSNHMRLNFGCPRSRLDEAIQRIERAFENR